MYVPVWPACLKDTLGHTCISAIQEQPKQGGHWVQNLQGYIPCLEAAGSRRMSGRVLFWGYRSTSQAQKGKLGVWFSLLERVADLPSPAYEDKGICLGMYSRKYRRSHGFKHQACIWLWTEIHFQKFMPSPSSLLMCDHRDSVWT